MNWIEKAEITVYFSPLEDSVVLHSPLARKTLEISAERYNEVCDLDSPPSDLACLADYIPYDNRPAVSHPGDYTLLTVLPNNRCNFACTYCYSAGCRDSRELDPDTLCQCIDYFMESKTTRPGRRKLTISFMGGGEPMLSWDIIKRGVAYASAKASKMDGVEVHFRIITNGSILSDAQIDYISRNGIDVSVSFEILEEIQNLQRCHFDIVDSNLRKLLHRGVDTQLNVTITPSNVDRMVETYNAMRQRYPEVKNAMFEPVTAEDMFATPADMRRFYNKYITGFTAIYQMGKQQGVDITSFPYLRTVFPVKRACPGEFCITADGKITGCYCVSTADHPLFNRSCYGSFTDGSFTFNAEIYQALMLHNKESNPQCAACSARWSCGGGCWHQFNTYSESYRNEICEFTRKFVEQIVRINVKISQK